MAVGLGIFSVVSGIVQGVNSINTARANAKALKLETEFQMQMADINNQILELDKQSAAFEAVEQIGQVKKAEAQVLGAQQAGYAAQGVQVGSGSAAQVAEDTRLEVGLDIITMKNNAMLKAFGYETQSIQNKLQANFQAEASRRQQRQTLVAGGLGAATSIVGAIGNYGLQQQYYSALGSQNKAAAAVKAVT